MIFTGSSGFEFYKNMILPSESEDGSFGFLILGRDPGIMNWANGRNGSKFAILAVLIILILYRFNRHRFTKAI